MKFVNKRAFTFAETLTALSLFSLILMLYLPAFYLEMTRMTELRTETQKWNLFHELVKLDYFSKSQNYPADNFEHYIFNDNQENEILDVASFLCENYRCKIEFSDGSTLMINLEKVDVYEATE